MQKLVADALVQPDAARHVLNVGPGLFAQIGDLVDEGDLRRQKRVGRVFGQFRGATPDKMQRRLVQAQGPINFGHDFPRARIVGADHHPVGTLEILDRRALAQKLRVRHDGEIGVRAKLADDPLDLVAGADRNRRFIDDDREAIQRLGDGFRGGVDIGKIRVPVAATRRRAHPDEHRVGAANRRAKLRRERQPALTRVGRDELVQPRLENRYLAPPKTIDLPRVRVDADHVMAKIRETRPRNQPNITRADHRDLHNVTSLIFWDRRTSGAPRASVLFSRRRRKRPGPPY